MLHLSRSHFIIKTKNPSIGYSNKSKKIAPFSKKYTVGILLFIIDKKLCFKKTKRHILCLTNKILYI